MTILMVKWANLRSERIEWILGILMSKSKGDLVLTSLATVGASGLEINSVGIQIPQHLIIEAHEMEWPELKSAWPKVENVVTS